MKNTVFTGAATAIITPMKNGGVDFEKFADLVEFQIKNGIDAIVVCGTTGESSTLTDEEHKELIRYCVEKVAGRVPVIAGTGSNDTDYAISLSKYACEVGADALLQVTPYYNKTTQRGLVKHFFAVADAVDKPIILYNVPSRTGVNIKPETCAELAKHERICAIKEASGSISAVAEIRYHCGDALDVYSGNDDQIVPILSLGGKGVISVLSNLLPAETHKICADFFAGNGARAIPAMIVSACMNDNPVMIYFGQEIGEQGMDTEGFSGRDGRTTIFDYWSVDSIRRWRNNGKFDDKLLTEEEKKLRTFYSRLLNLCNTEKAIREGVFFDLTYANLAGWVFNEHKQYAFMRKLDDELLLIMVNFDSIPVRAAVNIPQHAFDFLGIPYNLEYNAVELLTGNTEKLVLSPDKTTPVLLDAMNGKILKFKL